MVGKIFSVPYLTTLRSQTVVLLNVIKQNFIIYLMNLIVIYVFISFRIKRARSDNDKTQVG